MSIIKDNHLTLFRDLREAYREAHRAWVAGNFQDSIRLLRWAQKISSDLQYELHQYVLKDKKRNG